MQISLDNDPSFFHINSYEPGKITVNRVDYGTSLIVTPKEIISPWEPESIEHLQTHHLDKLAALKPQVVLLGTGEKMHLLNNTLRNYAYQHQVALEVMDTHAACRTFNLLIADNRFVVAAMLIR